MKKFLRAALAFFALQVLSQSFSHAATQQGADWKRYVIAHPAVSTVLVGYSTMDHLEYAARAIAKGPLSEAALTKVAEIQRGFAGEPR